MKRLGVGVGSGSGSIVLVVERTYFAGERVVEVADIVVPAESTKLVYNGPVGEEGPGRRGEG